MGGGGLASDLGLLRVARAGVNGLWAVLSLKDTRFRFQRWGTRREGPAMETWCWFGRGGPVWMARRRALQSLLLSASAEK